MIEQLVSINQRIIRLSHACRQEFFRSKLEKLSEELIGQFILFEISKGDNRVAQYKSQNLNSVIDRTLDLLEVMGHYNAAESTPLLELIRELLSFKLLVGSKVKKTEETTVKENSVNSTKAKPRNSIKKSNQRSSLVAENKQKILDYLRNYPSAKKKDIVEFVGVSSSRTINRNLAELIREGHVRRENEGRTKSYSISDR